MLSNKPTLIPAFFNLFSSFSSLSVVVPVGATLPSDAAAPVLDSFISLAIEFVAFPDFAGTPNSPNVLSSNLIGNLGKIQGSNPVVRVGGNSQDHATFDPSLPGRTPVVNVSTSQDPEAFLIAPGFFEAFDAWPDDVGFIYGFNLAGNDSVAARSLNETAVQACRVLGGNGKLRYWELGNEPDLYTQTAPAVRPSNWDEMDYVREWLSKSRILTQVIEQNCPGLVHDGKLDFMAPSFWDVNGHLNPVTTWNDGLGDDHDIDLITGHIYIDKAGRKGVTLQNTLMNHTRTVEAVNDKLNVWNQVTALSGLRFAFTEVNSLFNIGQPGISNTFGAALWGFDFSLYCASQGVGRVHWQQGTNFPYNAWQPITTDQDHRGVKAPYYSLVATATFLGNLKEGKVVVVGLPFGDGVQISGYAAYVNGALQRLAVVQMTEWNATSVGTRPTKTVKFQLPTPYESRKVLVQWLTADGSDATMGVTFAGTSYDSTRGLPISSHGGVETLTVGSGGQLTLSLPWSSAAVLTFD